MDVFVGAITTLIIIVVINYVANRYFNSSQLPALRYSQLNIYNMIAPYLDMMVADQIPKRQDSQASKYYKANHITMVIAENKAYWIKENQLYVADLDGGSIDKDSAEPVDTMAMDDVQLQKTLIIVEKLREANNYDNGGSSQP